MLSELSMSVFVVSGNVVVVTVCDLCRGGTCALIVLTFSHVCINLYWLICCCFDY